MYIIHSTLTKEYILSKITQEQIFEKYLGIDVQTDTLITSPLRKDNRPTCKFWYNQNGKLRLQDFSGHFKGDCFDVVGKKLNIDVNTKIGFNIVLDNIAQVFNLHKYSEGNITNSSIILDEEYFKKTKAKSIIEIKPRQFNKYDVEYWKKYNISIRTLEYFKVYPCDKIWLNNEVNYTYRVNDLAYAYYFGKNDFKIYFPNRSNLRFLSNTSVLQGINKLTCGKACIITKSYKDVMALKSFGIDAVAPSSETHLISRQDYTFIKQRYDFIFSLMDYDNTGIAMSRKLQKIYNIEPLYFTDKTWNRKKGIEDCKDFTDYIKKFGIKKANDLIYNIFNKYEPIFNEFDKYIYENLKWMN